MSGNEAEILAFIRGFWAERGFSPSHAEISAGTGRARNTVRRALDRLQAYGYLKKKPKCWRSVEVVKAA
jgi:DNA-binding IclR family transcriptional regulator